MLLRTPACLALLTALCWSGCKDREITSYRAPKDPVVTMPGATTAPAAASGGSGSDATMANTAVPTGSDNLTWAAPVHWTAKAPGAMRKGSFAIKGADGAEADLSITAFPGDTGGLLANLNRWRTQLSLPPLAENQLDGALEHLDTASGLHLDVVDFAGTANGVPTRTIGAVLPQQGETWFFKLMGPDALVAGEKQAFRDFLGTIKPRSP